MSDIRCKFDSSMSCVIVVLRNILLVLDVFEAAVSSLSEGKRVSWCWS